MNLQRYSPVLVFLVIAPLNTRNPRYRRGALRALDAHPSAFLNAEAPSPQNGTAPLLDRKSVV